MAGRDAYLELGFHEPPRRQDNASSAQAPTIARKSFTSAQSIGQEPPATIIDHGPPDRPGNEYMVGLIFVAIVLLLGLIGGFFVRGMFDTKPSIDQSFDVLSVQSVSDIDRLPSNASADIVFFGSRAADQMLAAQPVSDGNDMLLFAKSHTDGDSADASTRLLRYGASNQLDKGHSIEELNVFRGEGVDLIRLSNSALIATFVTEDGLSITRLNEAGRKLWSEDFATSLSGTDEITMAEAFDQVVIMAPHEESAHFRIVSIDANGQVRWETKLARPNPIQKALLTVDELGQSFAVVGTASNAPGDNDHSLAMIDSDGRVLRQILLPMAASETLLDVSPRSGGGAVAFITGEASRLVELDATGRSIGETALPFMQYLNDARLLPTDDNDVLIASTFALMGNRIDLVLENRGLDGFVLGQRTLSLPDGSSLDDIVRVGETEYIVTGSVRRDRYLPTDIFLQRISFNANFQPSDARAFADLTPEPLAQPLEATIEEPVESSVETIVDDSPEPTQPIEEEVAPVVASVAETEALTDAPEESIEILTPAPEADEATAQEAVIQDESDLISADTIEDGVATQCRFTCMDPATGGTFPMSGHFSSEYSSSGIRRTESHVRICRSAGLIPALDEQPECGVN